MINQNLLLAGDDAYNIQRSLRFRSGASAYLNRTPGSAGNRQKWTWSGWIKRGDLDSSIARAIFVAGTNGSSALDSIEFNAERLRVFSYNGSYVFHYISVALFRDPSAWYHITVSVDTTQATASNRVKIYVNGSQLTSFSTATDPALNANCAFFNTTNAHYFCKYVDQSFYTDCYLTEINFIDGQALTPSSFGMNDPQTGVWEPKKYTGTYGTNGFYLNFSDNSNNTATTIGKDYSGNGNNWTPNNISVTSGATYDSMTDVPTLTSPTAANYAVMNPLNQTASTNLSNANLTFTCGVANWQSSTGTIAVSSGKWYWEVTCGTTSANGTVIGIVASTRSYIASNGYIGGTADSYSYYSATGQKINNATGAAYGATFTTGDVIGVALDLDAGTLVFYKNNVSQGTAYSSLSGSFCPAISVYDSGRFADFNFGQRPFAYTPPSGFVALNTFNLPTPTIGATPSTRANKYFDATTYTGTGSSRSVANAGSFQPDFVWLKERNNAVNHLLYDSVRGVNQSLVSNTTGAEVNYANSLTAFTSTGFTVATASGVNDLNDTYVGWQWKANGTGVTNTAGSITSTVSANTTAGFSIVTYSGATSGAKTVGHGLGIAPKMIIVKWRTGGTSQSWAVYHASLGNDKYLTLQSTNASATDTNLWQNTAPTSSVFSVGYDTWVNSNGFTYVAYCFAEVAGYSRFGSYTGNGSADGPFVFCGFRPRYVMIKRTDVADDWGIFDTARDTFNVATYRVLANSSGAELSTQQIDILSNGFKVRNSNAAFNTNNGTYIFAAFAEFPNKYSLAR